jgi:hypothetical protein
MSRAQQSLALDDQEEFSFFETPVADPSRDSASGPLIARLATIDWNFPARIAHSDIEGLHPYPAKFIAELPRALLHGLPVQPRTAVLDPFCGSGTTLVECQQMGVPSFGIDLNPIACLMARVKTMPVPDSLAESTNAVLIRAQAMPVPSIPKIPNLDHWFMPQVQEALARLTTAIAEAREPHRDILRLALSSIVVRVSNQESDTRYAAVTKTVTADGVFSAFSRAAQRIADVLNRRRYTLASANILHADTLATDPKLIGKPISLVITSPPYPNAYEYWLYHKYRMWWLGFDPLAVKEREIGARAHFFKTNHHTAEDFVRQMAATFNLLNQVMVRGGFACFVIGRSRIHGKTVDNALIVEDVGRSAGFVREFSTERVLSPNRKSFNLSHANIKTETVLVLRFR